MSRSRKFRTKPPSKRVQTLTSYGRRVDQILEVPGLGRLTRSGRTIQLESNRTPAQQQELTEQLARVHPQIEHDIQSHVSSLATMIPLYDPLALLQRAYFNFAQGTLEREGEHDVDFDGVTDLRLLEYAHVLVVSCPPSEHTPLEDSDWYKIRNHVRELYRLLLVTWPSTQSAVRRLKPGYTSNDDDDEALRIPLLLDWLSVRGTRYPVFERERAESLLIPHDLLLRRTFGIDGKSIAEAIEEVQVRLSKGVGEALQTISDIQAVALADSALDTVNLDAFDDERSAIMALVDRTGRRAELETAISRACGHALFDITGILPDPLLRSISLEPGEDREFFAPGDYPGWPLRTPPTYDRPVFRHNERYYIFNPYGTDNLYRAIEMAVMAHEPQARQVWNVVQKRATESLPVEILCSLLPGATVYRDVEYPVHEDSGVKWCECDAVLVLDGFMLVIEVKAGKASIRSPLDATAEHLRNIRKLLIAPTMQAERFVEYVQSQPEVSLYDSYHREIGRLKRDEINLAVRCSVTADSLAAVAGHFQHKRAATSGSVVPPSWCISIDDLYAYRDVLRGPAHLRHFLTYRLRAFQMKELESLDELDHLGVYLETNAYTDWIADLHANQIGLGGYRAKLDKYFGDRWRGGTDCTPPTQWMPPVLDQIISALERSESRGRLQAGGAFLDLDGPTRESLANSILEARKGLGPGKLSRVVPVFGAKHSQMLFVGVAAADGRTGDHVDHAMSQLLIRGVATGILVDVSLAFDGTVTAATSTTLDLGAVSDTKRDSLRVIAATVAAQRFDRARRSGVTIGRNDRCLCGSGRKYKKCCMDQMGS